MISIVYGVPGSGKTYYAVWWIKKRALIDSDIFLRVRDDVILITNLKLNLDSDQNYVYIHEMKDFAKYMDVDFWRAHSVHGKKVYIVIDECQLFFSYYKDDPRVLFFLQYHRHIGVDILLITQTPKSLPAKVFELSEFLIEAVPRSVNPFALKAFRYRVLHPLDRDVVLRRFHLVFDYVIFYLYDDMIYEPPEEEEKPKNAFTRYYVLVASFLLLTVLSMFFFLSRVFSPAPSVAKSPVAKSPPVMQLQYDDLITEVPDSSSSEGKLHTKKDSPQEDSMPSDSQEKGFYYIEVGPKEYLNPLGPKEDLMGPKVIEIP